MAGAGIPEGEELNRAIEKWVQICENGGTKPVPKVEARRLDFETGVLDWYHYRSMQDMVEEFEYKPHGWRRAWFILSQKRRRGGGGCMAVRAVHAGLGSHRSREATQT